jgi:tRNA pseudouridine synthase 10
MELCETCGSANAPAFKTGSCYICEGKTLKTEGMVKKAAALLAEEDIRSFSISSIIPKEWLIREERVWDMAMGPSTESLKSIINRTIISSLRKATSLHYSTDGDCRAVFDYSTGRVSTQRNDLFVFGRYKKLVPGLSQSRWICTKCNGKGCKACGGKGKYYESVEERIGEPLKEAAVAGGYVLHASGREDVDATNSAGRPFVIMLKNPRKRKLDLEALGKAIGKSKEVSVENLSIVSRRFVEVVTESHFDKSYKAEVEFQRELDKEDIGRIKSLEGKTIAQKTPKRVVHRRADIIRHRRIKKVDVKEVDGRRAVLIFTAEAGTYIKELVSGDDGRTEPSIAGLLSTKAECKNLEVAEIDDGFIGLCLKAMYP